MLPFVVVPVVALGIKLIGEITIDGVVQDSTNSNAVKVADEIVKKMKWGINVQLLKSTLSLLLDIVIIAASILLLPYVSSYDVTIFSISLFYLISIVRAAYRTIKILYKANKYHKVYRKSKFKNHGMVKGILISNIYEEVFPIVHSKAKYETSGWLYWFFGSKSAGDIADSITTIGSNQAIDIIWGYIWKRTVYIVIAIGLCYALARFYVVPFLVEQATGMSLVETLLYPYLYSLDYLYHLFFN